MIKNIKQNKTKHNLDRQTSKISVLSSRNVIKYEFLTGKKFLLEKRLLKKAATIKRFEYSSLGSELEKQTSIAEYQSKFFKHQIKLINNNREDGIEAKDGGKTEDGEITETVLHRYICDEYKEFTNNIFTYGLKEKKNASHEFW